MILKPSWKIEFTERFRRDLRKLTKVERGSIGAALNKAVAAWGKPHLHAGSGIRHLRGTIYECRNGLKTRLAFEWTGVSLRFHMIGNHEEIARFIKTTRT